MTMAVAPRRHRSEENVGLKGHIIGSIHNQMPPYASHLG